MTMKRIMRAGGAVMLSALAASLLVAGVGAAPAAAGTATLSIPYRNCEGGDGRHYDYLVRVTGQIRITQEDKKRIEVRLWGDDPGYDDLLGGPYQQIIDGGEPYFSTDVCMNASTLNEDIGGDEIYAGVRVYGYPSGILLEKFESNRFYGSF
ncbi:MAG: hypothetical protein FWJ90_21200 [Actinomadura sp.]